MHQSVKGGPSPDAAVGPLTRNIGPRHLSISQPNVQQRVGGKQDQPSQAIARLPMVLPAQPNPRLPVPVPAPRLRVAPPKVTRRSRGSLLALCGCTFVMVAALAFVLRRDQLTQAQCLPATVAVANASAPIQDGLSIAAAPADDKDPALHFRVQVYAGDDLAVGPTPALDPSPISLRGETRANSQVQLAQHALAALDTGLAPRSPLYMLERCSDPANTPNHASAITIHVAAPAGQNNLNALDLYGWDDGSGQWRWLSGEVDLSSLSIRANVDHLPRALLLAQSQHAQPIVAAELPPRNSNTGGSALLLPPVIEEVSPYGFYLGDDGALVGSDARMLLPQSYRVIPAIRNWNDTYTNRAVLQRLLDNPAAQQTLIQHILDFTQSSDRFTGIELDLRGLAPEQSEPFQRFVADLAQHLHARGQVLILGLPAPIQQRDGTWANPAYPIGPLAALVDVVKVDLSAMTTNPTTAEPDTLHSLLNALMGQVSRTKLHIVTSALGVQRGPDDLKFVPLNDSLGLLPALTLSPAEANAPNAVAQAGQVVRVALQADALGYNAVTHQWCFNHLTQTEQGAQPQESCLGTAEHLRQVLAVLQQYHVRGITIRGLSLPGNDVNLPQLLQDFSRQRIAPHLDPGLTGLTSLRFSLVLQSPHGNLPVGEMGLDQPTLSFALPDRPGDYTLALMANGVRLKTNAVTFIVAEPSKP